MAELLRLENVWAGYGDATVLEDISLSLNAGESMALLGRNGMGKTSLLATLMGATRMRKGRIVYDGRDIAHVASHKRARAGLGWVPQEREVFKSLTVEENLLVVAQPGSWNVERIYDMFPRLGERKANLGSQLSGGEQQMLAMGRALMLNPRLLLLDEPLEGLAPLIAQELLHIIDRMVAEGSMAVILVEQHARQILPITRQALILERGRIVYQGPSAELLENPKLLDRWLGVVAVDEDTPDKGESESTEPSAARIPAIEAIQEEHRALAAVLQGLSHLINGIDEGHFEPDFRLLASIIDYISEMPDKVHHPKEDQIFARLRQYTHEVDEHLDRLEAEHAMATRATATMDRALVHYLQAGESGFAGFRDAVRKYIAEEWVHLGTEERHILPAARRFLSAEDWVTINQDFAHNGDPWTGENNEYADLFKRIANLAPAPIGVGAAPHVEG